jgi:hypothetical protein
MGTRPELPRTLSNQKYARTTVVPLAVGAGVAGVAGGEPDGSPEAGGAVSDGDGVRSGDPWATDGAGVGSSGGTVPADPLAAQAANRIMAIVTMAIDVIGFIGATPERWGSESNHRRRR